MKTSCSPLLLPVAVSGLLFATTAAASASPSPESGPWRVVDAAGDGVAGATITVYGVPVTRSPIERVSTRILETTSGEGGVVESVLPEVAELVIAIDHPGLAPRVAAGPPESFRIVKLQPGRSLTRRVVGEDERAVGTGDACMSFSLEAPRLERQLDFVRCGEVEDGRFTIEGLPEKVFGRLRVTAPGYLPLTTSDLPDAKEPLVLEPGFLISGRVLGADGEGIPGATVTVTGGEKTESGPEGGFAVQAPSLPAQIAFRARGHHRKVLTVTTVDPDKPLAVRLEPGPTLAARILGSDGRSPEACVARVLRYRPERSEWRTETRLELAALRDSPESEAATSAGNAPEKPEPSELYVDLPGEGEYRLIVAASGYSRHLEPTIVVGPNDHVDLGLIQLSQGAGVTARIVDSLSGEPIPGVLGELSPTGTTGILEVVGGGPAATTSDAAGHLRIAGQEAGRFELRLSHRNHGTRILDVELGRDEVRDLGDLWLGPGTEVTGRVTDRSGEPRSGLQVRIVGASEGSVTALAERTTRDDGGFAPIHLGAGEYRVEVHGSSLLLDQRVTIAEDQPEMDLDLEVGGTRWRGRVFRGGRLVDGGMLLVKPMSDTSDQRGRVMVATPGMEPQVLGESGAMSRTTVGRKGSFELVDAPTGLVLVTFFGDDGSELRERLVVPPDTEVRQDVRLTDSHLEGVVLDAESGTPLAGAVVRLRDSLNTVVANAVSQEDGAFVLTGFDTATRFQLEAELEGYRPRLLRGIGPEEGEKPLQVRLEPADSASLQVHLERSDGSRPARDQISLFSDGGWMLRSQILDPYGEIVFDDVAPGRYVLLWNDPLTGTGSASVEVQPDRPTRFDRRLSPAAPLVLDCGEGCAGEPLPGVAVFGEAGVDVTSHLPAVSPALRFPSNGRLVLGELQPGTYVVRTWLGGRHADYRVTARPGEPAVVVLGR